MREWVVVASRAEAKIFQRDNRQEELQWVKTLNNKKGRRKESEFNSDKPGLSYAKFSGSCTPHALEGKHRHAEEISRHFAQQISEFVERSFQEKKFLKLTILSGARFLGILKMHMQNLNKSIDINFIAKNVEKADVERISESMAQ